MIIDELRKENRAAILARDRSARAILSVLLTRWEEALIASRGSGKEPTDEDMVRILIKTGKELDEEEEGYRKVHNEEAVKDIQRQKEVVARHLPRMLGEDEIRSEIEKLADRSLPSVMRYFKEKFPGKCDLGLVNRVARSLK